MGRLSTAVAAAGVDADNLPEELPTVSLIDALLPASWTKSKSKRDKMPFLIHPFFRKPFKLFAIDADTGKPLDPNVHRKTRVTYYELQNGSNGSKKLVAHKTASRAGDKTADSDKAKPAEKREEREGEAAPAKQQFKGDDVAWTSEEDEKLKTMKGEGKTWAMIVEELGRAKHSLTSRWKEIDSAKANNQGDKKVDAVAGDNKGNQGKQGQGGNNAQNQGKKGKKGNNQNQNQGQNQNQNNRNNNNNNDKKQQQSPPKNDKHPSSNKNKPAITNGETRFTMSDWLTLQEDDIFSFGELQCLGELMGKDANQSWQRIAAKFFDLTGRRVHPDDVREKFERMAAIASG